MCLSISPASATTVVGFLGRSPSERVRGGWHMWHAFMVQTSKDGACPHLVMRRNCFPTETARVHSPAGGHHVKVGSDQVGGRGGLGVSAV
jgi:hypothetical protein